MMEGPAERDRLLRDRIRILEPDRFEQLVFALVRADDPAVRRLRAPDGGADVFRPANATERARVWQAKRYPREIHWAECEGSLDAAIARWDPDIVVFAFPIDLTQQQERIFEERLVRRKSAREGAVAVEVWTQSEVMRRLDERPEIRRQFFGPDQETLEERVDRAVGAGGKLDDGRDIVDRAIEIGAFAESQDAEFTHAVTIGGVDRESAWADLPYISLQIASDRAPVRIDTWARDGAIVELPSFSFAADEAGQTARLAAVRLLARGEQASITTGGQMRLRVPVAIQPFFDEATRENGTFTVTPGEPLAFELAITGPDAETRVESFKVRPVPPRPGVTRTFAGYVGNVLVEVHIELLEAPSFRLSVSFSPEWGPSASENVATAVLERALVSHERLALRSCTLFPSAGEMFDKFDIPEAAATLDRLEEMQRFYEEVDLLERELGVSIPIPAQFTRADMLAASSVADVLRTGQGTATFQQAEEIVSASEIPHVLDRIRAASPVRRRVTYEVFGVELDLGDAEYELPVLRLEDIRPHGPTPDAPARVIIAADGDDQMHFRLVGGRTESHPPR